jgi:hypothetical protein
LLWVRPSKVIESWLPAPANAFIQFIDIDRLELEYTWLLCASSKWPSIAFFYKFGENEAKFLSLFYLGADRENIVENLTQHTTHLLCEKC